MDDTQTDELKSENEKVEETPLLEEQMENQEDLPIDQEEVSGDLMSLLDIQDAINTRLKKLENLKEDLKPHKEMLDSIFQNDEDFQEKNEIAKKASKNKSEAKKRVLRQPQAAELNQKIEDIKNEGKEIQEALSYYLREYQRMTGANEFESADGELRQIVYIAKLVRKTNLNDE